jgi:hypothetical protein
MDDSSRFRFMPVHVSGAAAISVLRTQETSTRFRYLQARVVFASRGVTMLEIREAQGAAAVCHDCALDIASMCFGCMALTLANHALSH